MDHKPFSKSEQEHALVSRVEPLQKCEESFGRQTSEIEIGMVLELLNCVWQCHEFTLDEKVDGAAVSKERFVFIYG